MINLNQHNLEKLFLNNVKLSKTIPIKIKFDKINLRKKGFTLAEVLITLGIIGVVAAITIPTLMSNTGEKRLTSQFMKSYSSVTQALNKWGVDNQCIDRKCLISAYLADVAGATSEFNSYFNILKETDDGGLHWYTTADGSQIALYADSWTNYEPRVYFDINGAKLPNKLGIDRFAITVKGLKGADPSYEPIAGPYTLSDCVDLVKYGDQNWFQFVCGDNVLKEKENYYKALREANISLQ
ncbi:MAG TPA: type II secretion system protein [Candidatus Gastranaerophilaceae bacterium]|nr:type II secretion system protein [Candidatus Gastranaerophilaceae bacterium]